MANVNLDWNLVAQSYDKNKNGRVDDDLKVGNTGVKTVSDLAGALANDTVVVSGGVVQRATPGTINDPPMIKTLNNIHDISGQALGWGDPNYPGYQYQKTEYRHETYWDTETRYRTEQKLEDVTKYRTETQTVQVTKYRTETTTEQVTKYRDETIIKQETVHMKDGTTYTRNEPITHKVPYTDTETVTHQVPYTVEEQQDVQVPYTVQELHDVQVPYTVQVQKTRDVPYTVYEWGTAIQDIRARLQSIQTVAQDEDDSTCRQIAAIAGQALQQNDWQYAMDEGTAHTRYIALYTALQNINTLAQAPGNPSDAANQMSQRVAAAKSSVDQLQQTMKDPGLKNAPTRAQTQIAAERKAAAAIPWWHYMLLFGFFQKSGHSDAADTLQQDLTNYQSADPSGLKDQVVNTERQAYDTAQQGWKVKNTSDAQTFDNSAAQVGQTADGIKQQADQQNGQVQDLLKRLNSGN